MECARSEIEHMRAGQCLLWSVRRSVAGPSRQGAFRLSEPPDRTAVGVLGRKRR
jgi:hypothetical protein